MKKLAALVPPPRQHLIRYHGVLASHAADRAQIVPACGGPMRLVAALTDPQSRRTYLDDVGLDSRPPIAPARRLPQPDFDFAA